MCLLIQRELNGPTLEEQTSRRYGSLHKPQKGGAKGMCMRICVCSPKTIAPLSPSPNGTRLGICSTVELLGQ